MCLKVCCICDRVMLFFLFLVQDVQHVVYPKSKDCRFAAVGVSEIKDVDFKSDKKKVEEICIFSQEKLSDCEKIGTMVYSDTRGNNALEWKYLCNHKKITDSHKGVHLFDFEYVKGWVNHKGAEFLHCPLCKEGITEEKEKVVEHDIETMDQLIDRRDDAKKANDEFLLYHIEQLIFAKACDEKWDKKQNADKIRKNEKQLIEVINHWSVKKKLSEFSTFILDSAMKAIEKDNSHIIHIIIRNCGYHDKQLNETKKMELMRMINYATKSNSYDCTYLLLQHPSVEFEKRPISLLNAVKTMNADLIDIVFNAMSVKKQNQIYVCDDVFVEVIKKDLVDVAKKIVEARWHKPRDSDYELATKLEGLVGSWLNERRNAASNIGYMANLNSGLNDGDDDLNDWNADGDDDDWGNEDDDFNEDDFNEDDFDDANDETKDDDDNNKNSSENKNDSNNNSNNENDKNEDQNKDKAINNSNNNKSNENNDIDMVES